MVEARGNVLVQGGHSPGEIDFILVLPVELFWATARMLLCSGVKLGECHLEDKSSLGTHVCGQPCTSLANNYISYITYPRDLITQMPSYSQLVERRRGFEKLTRNFESQTPGISYAGPFASPVTFLT
jgi:hypothetical protein